MILKFFQHEKLLTPIVASSKDSQNLLEKMRWALILQRGKHHSVTGMKIQEAFHIATKGGAKNLGREDIST